jgi:hypothetical protein
MRTRSRGVIAATLASLVVLPLTSLSADAAPVVRFSRVQYDSPGSDTGSNSSLNAEWIEVTNHGRRAKVLTAWTIRDTAHHVYRFPTFKLRPGTTVRLHTGRGANTRRDLYWRQDWYVWDNGGDKAVLKNRHGITVDTCKWGDGDGNTAC